jgi:hypothetical protein
MWQDFSPHIFGVSGDDSTIKNSFSARRGYNRRPNRSWYAQRGIHQKNYSKYIGVSEHVTVARLEQVAAHFQSYLTLR